MISSPSTELEPLVSLVVSMYGVEAYLPAFLESLTIQGESLTRVEVIFVDDGSPDRSGSIAQKWLDQNCVSGKLVCKPNGGLSTARNLGIAEASGVWISFPDPDDILDENYLAVILTAIDAVSDAEIAVAGNILYLDDATGLVRDAHPLRHVFSKGTRVIELTKEPQAVKLQAATTFFRRRHIVENGLEFDHRIRPNFEDGAFMCRYQGAAAHPALVAVPQARYYYRQRADESSLVASSWTKTEKYIDLPLYGWLETLRSLAEQHGTVPEWAQNAVLYDMQWYFRYDGQIHTPTRGISAETSGRFMRIVRDVLGYIDAETILSYSVTGFGWQPRLALIVMRGEQLPLSPVHVWRVDRFKPIVQVKYYFSGERPSEEFLTGGVPIRPSFAKDRAVTYFGETVMYERILWLPTYDNLRIKLNGERVEVRYSAPTNPSFEITRDNLQRRYPWGSRLWPGFEQSIRELAPVGHNGARRSLLSRASIRVKSEWRIRAAQIERIVNGRSKLITRPRAKLTLLFSASGGIQKRFSAAWVFMDRDTQAQDNAEHLYRWVLKNRPDTNAWFVLRRNSADWDRLRRDGFRLVAFGSFRHIMLLKNAHHLISSHVDHYVVHPFDQKLYGGEPWAYTFLQHGVTKDDISRWLNGKPISMIVSAAKAEYDAFVQDGTPYVLTARAAKLTGFPRHDSLLEKARAVNNDQRTILVMPTWREYLMGKAVAGNHRDLIDDFENSSYVQAWGDYLKSPRLHEWAARTGGRIVFVPHPNLEAHVERMGVPESVDVKTYASSDVQEIIAHARILITDYSSLAFEAAYIETPVVYYQFDAEEFFSRHPHRPGYFNYREDGFGPVSATVSDAVDATIELLSGRSEMAKMYAGRARAFFPVRDGRNCERTYNAIRSIRSPEVSDMATELASDRE